MTNNLPRLLILLELPEDLSDLDHDKVEISDKLSTVICSAASHHPRLDDPVPRKIDEIARVLKEDDGYVASFLDPLSVIRDLIRNSSSAALEILDIIGEKSSARETIMSLQEHVEALANLDALSEDEDEVEEEEEKPIAPAAIQLATCIRIYALSIPRLHPRKKSIIEIIQQNMEGISSAARAINTTSTPRADAGRQQISNAADLVLNIYHSVRDAIATSGNDDGADAKDKALKEALWNMLDTIITLNANCINSSLAQRCFEYIFPRFIVRQTTSYDWKEHESCALTAVEAARLLNPPESLIDFNKLTIASVILLAHQTPQQSLQEHEISQLFPLFISSIYNNLALDETLSLLLRILSGTSAYSTDFCDAFLLPLTHLLVPLASSHPDAATRHIIFRLISMSLQHMRVQMRIVLLKGILFSEDTLPPMRIAGIGLLKENILRALSRDESNTEVEELRQALFEPDLMTHLGEIFHPHPSDIFIAPEASGARERFVQIESREPSRLTEVLSFYYVLLRRDMSNLSGVRGQRSLEFIERILLRPLRSALALWLPDEDGEDVHVLDQGIGMALVSLRIGLDRVDGAVREVHKG